MVQESGEIAYELSKLQRQIDMIKNELRLMQQQRNERTHAFTTSIVQKDNRLDDMREQLLGRLTLILYNNEYFPKARDLARFVQDELGIEMAPWVKKYKHHIIGQTVEQFKDLDTNKVREIYATTLAFKKKEDKIEPKAFFTEWEKTIRELKIRR